MITPNIGYLGDKCNQKFSFGEVYGQIYSRKFSFMAACERILMHFCIFVSNWQKAAYHPTICDVIIDVKLFQTVYRRIYCPKFFDVIQSAVAVQNQVH